ncbi:MAG: cob(I)yrinic acid a,c-diamide adenosyltransferase [Propionibacteriaceae bacterium]|nr:cob(I)yrinic acid a,c-diamide adenosyltransferase [Propionibacteriaceae bacterium]
MVNLTRIYTRTGDDGTTRLVDNSVTPKTDARLEAVGTVDEANCAIGVALTLDPPSDVARVLAALQNELFDLGADLATPPSVGPGALRIEASAIDRLERWCDRFSADVPILESFVLPGGSPLAAQLGVARTIVRRAERAAWLATDEVGLAHEDSTQGLNPLAIRYLNRLSDLLFIMARHVNHEVEAPEVLWVPGAQRT